jgi:hypothetical protein
LLFLLVVSLLAGRRCCCMGLGFHYSVCRYCRCFIVWCLVLGNSFYIHLISSNKFVEGIARKHHV